MSILSAGECLRKNESCVWRAANERMQLTWLLGAPNRPVSVHRRVCGRCGLGSPATQLMRAVRRLGQFVRGLTKALLSEHFAESD